MLNEKRRARNAGGGRMEAPIFFPVIDKVKKTDRSTPRKVPFIFQEYCIDQ
jgi:hypothetical protein